MLYLRKKSEVSVPPFPSPLLGGQLPLDGADKRYLSVGRTTALCLHGLVTCFQLSASLSYSPVRLEDA